MKHQALISTALLAACASLTCTKAFAGTIGYEHISCQGGYNSYEVHWNDPWSESLIFMERKFQTSSTWNFYIGYLADSGKLYPASIQYSYRMMAQPSGGSAYLDSNVIYVPKTTCTPPP